MGKKNRLYAKKPPLSGVDKAIYGFIIALAILNVFGIMLIDTIGNTIAYADSSVIALDNHILLSGIPLIVSVSLFLGFIAGAGLNLKQPIFGNKKFKPKGFEPTLKVYPLFSKEFRESLTPNSKKKIKKAGIVVLAILAVSFIILLFGISPRKVLDKDNNFRSYNFLNKVTHTADIEDAEKVSIKITRSNSRKGTTSYNIHMEFFFENEQYGFRLNDFGDMDTKETLEYMLYLKSSFDKDEYVLINSDKIEDLIFYEYLTDAEASLVYELFDLKE